MGAFEGLRAYFDQPLRDYAIRFGYEEANIQILEGNIDTLQRNHLQAYQNLLSCQHHTDKRPPIQYGQDLVASWIFEDYFLSEMREYGIEIHLSGADKNRTILPNQRTSTSSDYVITAPNGTHILMELVNDYTGFWYRNQKLHLRDNKYLQLKRNQSLLLAIALTTNAQKYATFDFRNDIPAIYIPSHRPYGYKPAYELQIQKEKLGDFSFESITKKLNDIIKEDFS